jgi:predicted GNAT superfamily acetyltransferase
LIKSSRMIASSHLRRHGRFIVSAGPQSYTGAESCWSLWGVPSCMMRLDAASGDVQVITQDDAERDAAAAAARASVVMGELDTVAGLREAADLFSRIWETPTVPPIPHDLLRSLVHAGGRVDAAFRDGHLVGAAVVVFSAPADAACYSLIAGVSPGAESRGIGLALKLAQRAWALRAGVSQMVWTFDPLLRRNAWFNLARLGAVGTEYFVDFYGEVADGVNDPETDRLAVTWNLRAPLPALTARARVPASPGPAGETEPPAILVCGPGDEPVAETVPAASSRRRSWIPGDIIAVRRTDPGLARRWRLAVRHALGGALAEGYQVTGIMDPGWYVLEEAPAGGKAPAEEGAPAEEKAQAER